MKNVKRKIACITLDLEPDHAGFLGFNQYSLWKKENLNKLCNLFYKNSVPLTIFVVGESIRKNSQYIKYFTKIESEFNLHSNTHNFSKPDTEIEIVTGVRNFIKYFGYKPKGYRAPKGLISSGGLKILSDQHFLFDSSIIPSFWPHPKYLKYRSKPFYHKLDKNKKLFEIPISVTPILKLPLSLSFIKLFGMTPYKQLISGSSPNVLVFNFHLHDIFKSNYFDKLSFPTRMLYKINHEGGFKLLSDFVSVLKKSNYQFILMNQLVKEYEK